MVLHAAGAVTSRGWVRVSSGGLSCPAWSVERHPSDMTGQHCWLQYAYLVEGVAGRQMAAEGRRFDGSALTWSCCVLQPAAPAVLSWALPATAAAAAAVSLLPPCCWPPAEPVLAAFAGLPAPPMCMGPSDKVRVFTWCTWMHAGAQPYQRQLVAPAVHHAGSSP